MYILSTLECPTHNLNLQQTPPDGLILLTTPVQSVQKPFSPRPPSLLFYFILFCLTPDNFTCVII